MSVRKAKSNPTEGVTTYYVPSRTEKGKRHMVVRFDLPTPLYFCQCSDYFGRRLPHLGRNTSSLCEHANEVRRKLGETPAKT